MTDQKFKKRDSSLVGQHVSEGIIISCNDMCCSCDNETCPHDNGQICKGRFLISIRTCTQKHCPNQNHYVTKWQEG